MDEWVAKFVRVKGLRLALGKGDATRVEVAVLQFAVITSSTEKHTTNNFHWSTRPLATGEYCCPQILMYVSADTYYVSHFVLSAKTTSLATIQEYSGLFAHRSACGALKGLHQCIGSIG